MENILQNVRARLYQVVSMLDRDESTRLESALLKSYACQNLTNVADHALSIYAAIGYTKEIRAGRTTEVMDYIAGRQLVKKYAK